MNRSRVLFLASCAALATPADPATSSTRFVHVSPVPGSRLVSAGSTIILRSPEVVDPARLDPSGVRVVGSASGLHPGTLMLSSDERTLVFVPDQPFHLGERVVVEAAPLRAAGGDRAEISLDFTITPRRVEAAMPRDVEFEPHSPPRVAPASASPTVSALVGPLPPEYPPINFNLVSNPEPGAVFMGLRVGQNPSGLVIVDNAGQPLFYRRTLAVGTDFTMQQGLLTFFDGATGGYLALDAANAVVDSFKMGNGYSTDFHDLRLMPNGHALLMAYDPQPVAMDTVVPGGNPNATVIGLVIQEIDADKNVIFQWRSWDHFQITDGGASCMVNLLGTSIDYVHGNSFEIDHDGDILISSRHMNEVTKISRTTGNVIWRFGTNAINNQFTILGETRGFSHQHDARRLPNGNITLYDNGNCLTPQYSRAVEYQLDEVNMIATQVWEFRDTPDNYGPATGSVQRRATGGTMICWGSFAKVSDLHPNGTKSMEITFGPGYRTYRAHRFPWSTTRFSLSPETLDFGSLALGDSVERALTIHNDWDQAVEIDSVLTSSEWFRIWDPMPMTIPAGDSASVTVWFKALGTGEVSATFYARTVSNVELLAATASLRGAGPAVSATDPGTDFALSVHPSPSRGATQLSFSLPSASPARIRLLDVQGRLQAVLVDGALPAGRHERTWNPGDAPAGIYFVHAEIAGRKVVRRVALIR
jgi:Arylsulfotransferase (ASST)/Transmembrane protein 131-like N-terminal